MWAGLGEIIASPVFEDEEKTRVAGLLNSIIWATMFIVIARVILALLAPSSNLMAALIFGGVVAGVAVWMHFLMRSGRVRIAGFGIVSFLWMVVALASFSFGGVRGYNYSMCMVIALVAGLLLGGKVAIGYAGASIVMGFMLFSLENRGVVSPDLAGLALGSMFGGVTVSIIAVAVLVYLYHSGFSRALARARSNEQALAERAREIIVFRELAGNAADAILMSTLEGEITYANRVACRLFDYDYKQQEMVGLGIADLTPTEGSSINEETIITTWHSSSWRGEFKCRRKDGSFFDAFNTIFPVRDETGEPIALGYIIRDATEQKQAEAERELLQQEVIEAQRQALLELSAPVIPVMDTPRGGIIVMPLVGNIDSMRAKDITRTLLAGIRKHRAKMVILDITGVPVVDSGVASYLNKTILTARLKGAGVIVTGVSDAVAETIVDLGIDWSGIETRSDLQTGLITALDDLGIRLIK
jgi:PAS domain S-box-containing protein